jgi:hypothetical protein
MSTKDLVAMRLGLVVLGAVQRGDGRSIHLANAQTRMTMLTLTPDSRMSEIFFNQDLDNKELTCGSICKIRSYKDLHGKSGKQRA